MDDLVKIFNWLSSNGLGGAMLALLYAGWRKWLVFGWYVTKLEADVAKAESRADFWQNIALRGIGVAEHVVGSQK